jgi:hypothetical protein
MGVESAGSPLAGSTAGGLTVGAGFEWLAFSEAKKRLHALGQRGS